MPPPPPDDDLIRPASPRENTIPPELDPADPSGVVPPPQGFAATLRQLGPGLIIAGSIVGSGELIATTKTGAQAGIVLLWLIILGCLIKVFVQIELGRVAITHGVTTLAALNRVPGRIGPANWILWFWLAMMAASIAQLGGIVGGVGQSLAMAFPLRGDYLDAIEMPSAKDLDQYLDWDETLLSAFDLQLLESAAALAEAPASNPGDPIALRAPGWLEAALTRSQALFEAIPREEQAAVLAAFAAAFPPQPLTPRELAARREALRERLQPLNHRAIEGRLTELWQTGRRKTPPSQETIRRIATGHAILAEQLTQQHRRLADRQPLRVLEALVAQQLVRDNRAELGRLRESLAQATEAAPALQEERRRYLEAEIANAARRCEVLTEMTTWDDKYWAALVTFLTIGLLYNGRYGVVQNLSTVLVVLFTFITIGNVVSLQTTDQWRLSGAELWRGLSFGLPDGQGLKIALATFGIIGVGATELITYPYWCIEKGYARFTGWRSDDPRWAARARGWMRVMHWDAFLSMLLYTVATVAFYLMGAAVLHGEGRDPDGMRMVSTLVAAYVPVFGEYAKYLFLVGAIAVLYSTFLVANAGHARMFTDGLKVFGLLDRNSQSAHNRSITFFCVLLPLVCLTIFWSGINPVEAVAFAGMMQATMLPMIGFGALYWRFTATDPRLAPRRGWDVLLVLSCLGLLVVGVYGVWQRFFAG